MRPAQRSIVIVIDFFFISDPRKSTTGNRFYAVARGEKPNPKYGLDVSCSQTRRWVWAQVLPVKDNPGGTRGIDEFPCRIAHAWKMFLSWKLILRNFEPLDGVAL